MSVTNPELLIAVLATAGIFIFIAIRTILWLAEGPRQPDPWDETVTALINEPEATRLCHRCMTPHDQAVHFCSECGAAVGDYNNLLPWVNTFSEGEVFRNGAVLPVRRSPLVIGGYLVSSFAAYAMFGGTFSILFAVLVLLYWFRFFKNLAAQKPGECGAAEVTL
jgi:hypothetical protein